MLSSDIGGNAASDNIPISSPPLLNTGSLEEVELLVQTTNINTNSETNNEILETGDGDCSGSNNVLDGNPLDNASPGGTRPNTFPDGDLLDVTASPEETRDDGGSGSNNVLCASTFRSVEEVVKDRVSEKKIEDGGDLPIEESGLNSPSSSNPSNLPSHDGDGDGSGETFSTGEDEKQDQQPGEKKLEEEGGHNIPFSSPSSSSSDLPSTITTITPITKTTTTYMNTRVRSDLFLVFEQEQALNINLRLITSAYNSTNLRGL